MRKKTLLPRLLIGLVTFFNLQCAVLFLLRPEDYLGSFELSDFPGMAAVQGMGVLFIMWNIPYLAALWDPFKYRTALILALVMQAVGVLGESWILLGIPPDHELLRASISRFILFDFGGLLLLGIATWLIIKSEKSD